MNASITRYKSMRTRVIILFIIFLCNISIQSFSQQDERIKASYMLAFGRAPFPSELNYWLGRGNLTIAQLIDFHRQGFIEIPVLHKETILNSYNDALGRKPSEDELKYWMNDTATYLELMSNHLQLLKLNNWENERVIKLSYLKIFHREPGVEEMNLWKKRGVAGFFFLEGYLEIYKKKNQMEGGNVEIVNIKDFLFASTISLSPSVASEAMKIISKTKNPVVTRTISQHGGSIIAAGKRNISEVNIN